MRNLTGLAKKNGGSGIWEVESVESYLGSEDVHDVMCMDAHCWSARGEKNKMCHPHGDSLKESMYYRGVKSESDDLGPAMLVGYLHLKHTSVTKCSEYKTAA
jgi:hypothetical protein